MADQLPQFRKSGRDYVLRFAQEMLTNPFQMPPKSHLVDLVEYEDGHYRAVFDPEYFILPAGDSTPSKSQWNTLKKKIKRHNPTVFIFKEHGEIVEDGRRLFTLDFGFFQQHDQPKEEKPKRVKRSDAAERHEKDRKKRF